jgi:hypothetical protein
MVRRRIGGFEMKMKWMFIGLFMIAVITLTTTNPTKEDYEAIFVHPHVKTAEIFNKNYQLERINFFLFSTYTPIVAEEHGKTYLGILGHFFPISEGQFDYPKWLELFN